VTEATTSVPWAPCEAVVRALTFPCDLMPLKEVVLQIIDRVGGKRENVFGQKVTNQCFRYGLLQLELERPDGTSTWFSKTDCEHLTICAAPINPAEAVWVEPREDGRYFVQRPDPAPTKPTLSPSEPSATREPPVEAGQQELPDVRLPEEPQLEEPRKWSPKDALEWLEQAKRDHPQREGENKNKWAQRLYDHMKTDFGEDIPWTGWLTLRRRLDDPSTGDD
jgi:hypothetical protein